MESLLAWLGTWRVLVPGSLGADPPSLLAGGERFRLLAAYCWWYCCWSRPVRGHNLTLVDCIVESRVLRLDGLDGMGWRTKGCNYRSIDARY